MIYYFENGQKQNEGEFEEGFQEGNFFEWHENGKPAIQGFFKLGQKDSLWTYWDETGSKRKEEYYFFDDSVHLLNLWNAKSEKIIDKGKGHLINYYPDGKIKEEGPFVLWIAPDELGTFTITAQVSDGKGGEVEESLDIEVKGG